MNTATAILGNIFVHARNISGSRFQHRKDEEKTYPFYGIQSLLLKVSRQATNAGKWQNFAAGIGTVSYASKATRMLLPPTVYSARYAIAESAAHAMIPSIFLFYAAHIAFTPLIVSYTLEILPYPIHAKVTSSSAFHLHGNHL